MTISVPKTVDGRIKRVVGINKAAQYAGVSRWTVNEWLAQGKLPYLRYPGRKKTVIRRIDLDDVDAFMRKHRDRNA